ncbi:protealysin inhibitor emfourin [Tropicibacter sp. Alg240-R139]|uniref:protealysin inhibitor emfourin n=1 Tax=Tropicibacter sp. Alg240-R139 TaxID=2305991 RepID=UPI0013E03028|nr:protealysin inhibitor emfourin [Tropicibacter sp. Alg240-R139]
MGFVTAGCLVMMIKISTSGGFGGLSMAGVSRVAMVEDLPAAQLDVYCKAFAPDALQAMAQTSPPAGRADTVTYQITVTDADGAHQFELDETQLPPDLLDLIDALPQD